MEVLGSTTQLIEFLIVIQLQVNQHHVNSSSVDWKHEEKNTMPPKRKSNGEATPKTKKKKVEEDGSDAEEDIASPAVISSGKSDPKELGLVDHPHEATTQYKFISFNVNGINALMKKDNYLDVVCKGEKPTCLCLQETKLSSSKSAKYEKIIAGYTAHFNNCTAKVSVDSNDLFIL